MSIGEVVRENPGIFAVFCVRYLLLLVAVVALVRLCRQAGQGRAWALLALLPLITYPFAYGGIFLGVFTPEEAEVIMTLFLAILPMMLVRLAIRRGPAKSAA